jgi:cardiolipin synthase
METNDLPSLKLLTVNAATSDGAAPAFDAILRHIEGARESIVIHMYVWRSDTIGNAIGAALLAAAERGVEIHLIKDTGAFLYERSEMNRKSFFNRPVSCAQRLLFQVAIRTLPDTFVPDAFDHSLGDALIRHPKVSIEWVNHTHTKYYLFDGRVLITGSVNIEDRHRGYFDYMVEVVDPEVIADFSGIRGRRLPPGGRDLAVIANIRGDDPAGFQIVECVLSLIAGARKSIRIEMAYLGDPEVTAALVEAANRGVEVIVLFSKAANIGNDLNYRTVRRLFKAVPILLYRTPKMIHSKMMLVDDETVLFGSANLSLFSMRKAEEVDILIRHRPEFAAAFRDEFEARRAISERITAERALTSYGAFAAAFQQWSQKRVAG